ncbi:NADH dehydrogenase [ubiquinone] 1 beta subcomplex subunit 11, mitochondrial [Centruroides vittatus]|uniref:NADH dehydrogenase [ubiquinone] 1 beta subcomplex subunit 11, mitochondrial n=1 Tax=Centruroides vittatus TaxID=120091 RepID=UPI00350E97B7
MASICRTGAILHRYRQFLLKCKSGVQSTRHISTSNKNKETASIEQKDIMPRGPQTAEEFADVKSQKNWISYGFDMEDKEEDRSFYRTSFFMLITVCVCGIGFIIMYLPDFRYRDWTMREAYLELHRREKLGLPLIDKNLIDPSKIELPPDEDLVDTEIII